MVRVVPGVLDGDIPEDTAVRPQDVIRPEPHLLSETKQYLGERKRWPVRPPVKPSRVDELFAALRRAVPRPKPREARRNACISVETWRLIDERVSTRQDPRYGTLYRRRLGKAVQASLAADRRRRAEDVGAEVEALVKADPPLIQEVWYRLQG